MAEVEHASEHPIATGTGSAGTSHAGLASGTVTHGAVTHGAVPHGAVPRADVAHGAGPRADVAHGAVARRGGAEVVPTTHRHEQPGDWGWHANLGRPARLAGWLSVIALLLMTTATQYNMDGTVALLLTAAAIAGSLLMNARRRRTAWRR